ncbi:hypothetical protein SAMN06309944_0119 [Micrococcales bacterium KH10]|nr:hypothetical protein SAMN06309944_0119 [Micrococcales bacterium KH10]
MKIRSLVQLTTVFLLSLVTVIASVAQASTEKPEYRLGQDSLVNAGHDTGYSKSDPVNKNDIHWGWQLGRFYVTDFTRAIQEDDGTVVFLKNVGDEITLWFDLEQDIDRLNDDDQLSIAEDKNGWDQHFQVSQQNFGRGMLIVKHTDYTNNSQTTEYRDFLAAKASTSAVTTVEVFEEGDYEVALDYEIRKPWANVFGWKPRYNHHNYQISFKFAVRNGNSMVFPFDVKTGAELTNASATTNGFRLDLAKSRYLDIDIKREVLNESGDGLAEDTRFNKPAKDGSEYTDEGTYTITVRNRYTGQETLKTIYVGSDDVLKAHAATGESIPTINEMIAEGATIAADGSIIPVRGPTIESDLGEASEIEEIDTASGEIGTELNSNDQRTVNSDTPWSSARNVVSIVAGTGVLILLIAMSNSLAKRRRTPRSVSPVDGGEDL